MVPVLTSDEVRNLVDYFYIADDMDVGRVELCINSIKSLSAIALKFRPERFRVEFIPFLTQVLGTYPFDILLELVEKLDDFTDYVGGPDFVCSLLPLFGKLAELAIEGVIRDKLIKSLCKLAELHSDTDFENHFVKFLIKLITSDGVTSRSVACGLLSICYSRVNQEMKSDLVKYFCDLSKNVSSIVRGSVAKYLGPFSKVAGYNVIKNNNFIVILLSLTQDKRENIRSWVVDAFISIASLVTQEDIDNLLLPKLKSYSSDKSWKVRFTFSDHFTEIQKAVGLETSLKLVPNYVALLYDTESVIRANATSKICEFYLNLYPVGNDALSNDLNVVQISKKIDETMVISILPVIQRLILDDSLNVRLALSRAIVGLSSTFGRQRTIDYLLPLFLIQLEDECPEVCLSIISQVDCINKVIGTEQITEVFLNTISTLAKHSKLKVRQSLIEHMPLIASQFGEQFFIENFNKTCILGLYDNVYSVRIATIASFKKLAKQFGADWTMKHFFLEILCLASNPSYLFRMTLLFCINEVAEECDAEMIAKSLLPVVLEMSCDKVANVRFNVAKTLKKIGPSIAALDTPDKYKIKLALEQLSTDQDRDVQYFAAEAKSIFASG